MKKISTLITAMLAVLLSFTFTSCDEDSDIAYTLEGTWKGNMYVSSTYNGRTYDTTYSEICFLRDPYTYSSGTGYWIDHYRNTGWGRNYVANHIEWTVDNGTITVYFMEERTTVQIRDYGLNGKYFKGTIYYGKQIVDFRLTHVSSPNWSDYDYGRNHFPYGRAVVDSTTTNEQPVRFFREK